MGTLGTENKNLKQYRFQVASKAIILSIFNGMVYYFKIVCTEKI